jgi:hypothetical protein
MTDPRNPDDSWGELYRELGVDDPGSSKPSPPDEDAEVIELTESDTVEVGEPAQPFVEDGVDETEEPEGETVSAEGEDEGEPGQKKRRRRRRRRKKKGVGQPGGEPASGEASEFVGEGEAEESETQLEEDEEEPEAITGPGVEEEATPEMTRDIIANWNVPSWEEIVAGLHRPDR